jgi:hypothetical protein
VRRANAIRRFHPGVLSYEGRNYWLRALLLNGRGALAAPAGGLHPPYALVLGYMAALAAGAPTLPSPGEKQIHHLVAIIAW